MQVVNYDKHYANQAGTGLADDGYEGTPYHVGGLRGRGIGTLLRYLPKALKYIGRIGLSGLKTFGDDLLSGKDVSKAGHHAIANTAQEVIEDANNKLQRYKEMKGKGIKRKGRTKKSLKKKETKKPKKRSKLKKKVTKIVKKVYKSKGSPNNYI